MIVVSFNPVFGIEVKINAIWLLIIAGLLLIYCRISYL